MMHARRYFFKALDSDQQRMGRALYLTARLYGLEGRAKGLTGEQRLELRKRLSAPVAEKLHQHLYSGSATKFCRRVRPQRRCAPETTARSRG